MDDVAKFGPGKRLSHVHEEDREEKGDYSQGSRNCPYFLLPTVPPTPYLHLSRCGHLPLLSSGSDCDFGEWDIPRGNTDIPA